MEENRSADHPPYLVTSGNTVEPTPIARGPWGETVAGHVTGGLLAASLEQRFGDTDWQPTRLTVDLMRPAFMQPIAVTVRSVRDGRRIRLAEAELHQGDEIVARASALFLRRGEQPDQRVWCADVDLPAAPTGPVDDPGRSPFFLHAHGWGPDAPVADLTPGPKFAWIREVRPLIDASALTGFVRCAMAADVTNPLANWGTAGLRFINADYTVSLSRLPRGELVGLAAHLHSSHDGISSGTAILCDEQGVIGSCIANALSDNRFSPPDRLSATRGSRDV